MASDILHNLNEIFLHNFPGKSKAEPHRIQSHPTRAVFTISLRS